MSEFGSMSVEAYLNQDTFYFSESEGRMMVITDMVPHHALNAYKKLLRELGDNFPESLLAAALAEKFLPDVEGLKKQMAEYGKAAVAADLGVNTARSRLRRAGAAITRREGQFVVGYPKQIQVTLRGHKS